MEILAPSERKRLTSILGMLGSNSAGERDNAARLAEHFRREHGLSWEDLMRVPVTEAQLTPAPPSQPPSARSVWSEAEKDEWLNHSEWALRQQVGDKKVDAVIAYFKAAKARDPRLLQQLFEQRDPYIWALSLMERATPPPPTMPIHEPQTEPFAYRSRPPPWNHLPKLYAIVGVTLFILAYFAFY